MLTSNQRAFLKGLASTEDTILMVGKGGISPEVLQQADDALEARELIKGKVLDTAPLSVKEVAAQIAEAVGCEVVQTIGFKFVLYRAKKKDPIIQLPKPSKKTV